ncbi:MAG: hypothetical protein H7222_02510 [Methylotenera sp.]|nr:hypothetical protein [Oligoflexia bacterium]
MSERELRICEFNVENLFISMDYYQGQDLTSLAEGAWRELALVQLQRKQKPIAKVWGLAHAILDIDPDILMLTEVGGRDSLVSFNQHFLNDQFEVHFVEGNSRRNIDLAFLVKKGLPYQIEAHSNRDTPIEVNTYQGRYLSKFSRDVAELRLLQSPRSSDSNPEVHLILLLVHLKSKITSDQDFKGKDVRMAEAVALAGLYNERRVHYPETPILVGGDFNTDLASLELELLKRTDLQDFHDLLQTPEAERISLVHFDYAGVAHPSVLDYLLISPHLVDRVVGSGSGTYRYKGFYGIPEPLPQTPTARYQMPSDHYPLVLTVKFPDVLLKRVL